MMQRDSGVTSSISAMSQILSSGMLSRPRSRARRTFFFIDSPRVAMRRPSAMAMSAICWMRWMWLAKQAVMMRWPLAPANRPRRDAPMELSERVWPSSSALVESLSSRRMPLVAEMAPMRARSVVRPSTGVRSSFQSPECRITPWGVPGGGEAVGNGVGDGDELDIEGSDLATLPVLDRDELGAVQDPGLVDAIAGDAEAEGRAVDGERQVPQEVGERPHMVFVAMRQHAAVDPVGVLPQPGEVGQHQVDAEHLGFGNINPQSSRTMRPSSSKQAQLRPISPRPPRKVMRTGLGIQSPSPCSWACTWRARSSRPSGAGPMGGRHWPT